MTDIQQIRSRFPALSRTLHDKPVAWLDGPGGTQVPSAVIDALAGTLRKGVSNLSTHFAAGRDAIAIEECARTAIADLLGAAQPQEIVFGQNMTSLTLSLSRAVARTWNEGDSIVVTKLDHDANVTPWVLAARDRGVTVHKVDVHDDGRLDMNDLEQALSSHPRLVAVTAASNALGTHVDVAKVTHLAHAAGALVAVDAVHAAPHRFLDVREIGCDFLVCSSYKFFGPHTGVLYGRMEHLERLDAYKVRPAPAQPPGKWETGTQSFESLAGVTAAVDYLASLSTLDRTAGRRDHLRSAYDWISHHETQLAERFLTGVQGIAGVTLWGIDGVEQRTPTFAVTLDRTPPAEVAARLGGDGIFIWSGHYYALEIMKRLGLLDTGGAVRIGFVHYNTIEEVDRVLDALAQLASQG